MATMLISGANRGIGLALARAAARRGDDVIACARAPEQAEALRALAAEGPGAVAIEALDAASEASAAALAARLAGRPIDALVANAGVLTTYGGFGEAGHREAGWRETLMVNVYGPFALAEALVENAAAGAGKKIAIVSSVMGSSARATGGAYAYRASKAAAVNLARNLATDLRPRGIAVGAYHPGWVRTEMGGPNADIAVEESAAGLLARIDALTLARTGVFEDHQGAPVPF